MRAAIPNVPPRWRKNSTGETARTAAQRMTPKAPSLRERVLDYLEHEQATPERIFAELKAQGVACVLTSVRPRCSELVRMGLIADSGRREPGEGGSAAIVWRATTELERVRWRTQKAEAERRGESWPPR
jgi:hypothetical protein